MRISAVEDYSLRCLSHLARNAEPGRKLTIAEIAAACGLSEENTAKILSRLRKAGLVLSFRGKEGGYQLARSADEITLADAISGVSGEVFELERCTGGVHDDACVHEDNCGIRPIWLGLGRVVERFLSSVTLTDVIERENAVCSRMDAILDQMAEDLPGSKPKALRVISGS